VGSGTCLLTYEYIKHRQRLLPTCDIQTEWNGRPRRPFVHHTHTVTCREYPWERQSTLHVVSVATHGFNDVLTLWRTATTADREAGHIKSDGLQCNGNHHIDQNTQRSKVWVTGVLKVFGGTIIITTGRSTLTKAASNSSRDITRAGGAIWRVSENSVQLEKLLSTLLPLAVGESEPQESPSRTRPPSVFAQHRSVSDRQTHARPLLTLRSPQPHLIGDDGL